MLTSASEGPATRASAGSDALPVPQPDLMVMTTVVIATRLSVTTTAISRGRDVIWAKE
jgi:hypothetical protein